jgi:hypothetical protein
LAFKISSGADGLAQEVLAIGAGALAILAGLSAISVSLNGFGRVANVSKRFQLQFLESPRERTPA